MIDNTKTIEESILKFNSPKTFYIVEALCRPKKDGASTLCGTTNNHTRMVRLWTFASLEEFRRHRDEIINICEANNARGYILPQRRSVYLVMKQIMRSALDNLEKDDINFNRFITSALCGCHEVADKSHKRWVIDIDADEPETVRIAREWSKDDNLLIESARDSPIPSESVKILAQGIASKIRRALVLNYGNRAPDVHEFMPNANAAYSDSDICVLKTPHGYHIVTPPFNREQKALQKYLGGDFLKQDWIKPDAMALLYAPSSIGTEARRIEPFVLSAGEELSKLIEGCEVSPD